MTPIEQILYQIAPTWLGRDGICAVYEAEHDGFDGLFSIIVETLDGIAPEWLPDTVDGFSVRVIKGGPYEAQGG